MAKVDCVEEAIKKSFDEGKDEGIGEGNIEMVKNLVNKGKLDVNDACRELLSLNCDFEIISRITGLSVYEIKILECDK